MISKYNKLFYDILTSPSVISKKRLAVSLFVFIFFTFLFGSLYSRFSHHTVEYDYFSQATEDRFLDFSFVGWDAGVQPAGRRISQWEETKVGRAITSAWSEFANQQQKSGNLKHLQKYFTGIALDRAKKAAKMARKENTVTLMLNQHSRPVFYHADASILLVESQSDMVTLTSRGDGYLKYFQYQECSRTVLYNKTSGWKIANHERSCLRSIPASRTRPQLPFLKGINYYPAKSPWSKFFEEYNPEVVRQDFELIRSLGANSIRIFIPYRPFLKDSSRYSYVKKLRSIMQIAKDNSIFVVPTLFDLKGDYNLGVWSSDIFYLKTILNALKDFENIAFIDLKNEPDLDFKNFGQPFIRTWLSIILNEARKFDPNRSYSIGWAHPKSARFLANKVDVVSFHGYGEPKKMVNQIGSLKQKFPEKPIIITEIGSSTYSFLGLGFPGSKKKQKRILENRLNMLDGVTDGIMIWTLYDFKHIDPKAIGGTFWNRRIQSHFGIIDSNGRNKLGVEVFQRWTKKIIKKRYPL